MLRSLPLRVSVSEHRGGYYDSAGALRDMVPNHLLQMVGLTAMEPPSSLDADAIRNEVSEDISVISAH